MADLQTIAGLILKEGSNQTFNLVVRWVLGDQGSDALPAHDALFEVFAFEAELTTNNPLPPDEPVDLSKITVRHIRDILRERVKPRLYFMLDTVRNPEVWPYGGSQQWMQVTRPTTPPEPLTLDKDHLADQPFGVINLLQESELGKVTQRVSQRMLLSLRRIPRKAAFAEAQTQASPEDLAARFANWFVQGGARAAHLPHIIRQTAAEMSGTVAALSQSIAALPEMNLWDRKSFAPHVRMQELAIIANAVSLGSTFDDIRQLEEQARQVRGHIRLRTLHGGKVIDYWSDPDNGTTGVEADRGKQSPASEALGLGKSFTIDRADLQAISDARHGIVVTVTQLDKGTTTEPAYSPGTSLLFQETHLKYALKGGTSHPPKPSTGASVNYELVEMPQAADAALKMEGRALGFRTGDGRIEITIDALPDHSATSAWNVYGMWEGHKDSQYYFDNPAANPSLADLAPWLITRRYSYARDLAPALVDGVGAPLKALDVAIRQPPWQPLLPVPAVSVDQTSEASGKSDQPLPVKGDKNSGRFAFDLRQGFIPTKIKPAGGVPEWDIAAPPDPQWSARNWRPGSARAPINAPQRYRFWVTAVDQLEQESDPLAVDTTDVDAGEMAGNIFYLRQRSRLMPPPGNESGTPLLLKQMSPQGDFSPLKLRLTFSTPYASRAANQQQAGTPPTKEDPATLTAWVCLLRKRPKFDPKSGSVVAVKSLTTNPWQAEIQTLINEGWEQIASDEIQTPEADGTWRYEYETDDLGAGYLYIAVAAFRVKDEYADFWMPDVASRQAQLVQRQDDALEFYPDHLAEVVASSPLGKTAEILVVDARAPNQPANAKAELVPAKPVLPPPGLDRDLVLQRLVSTGFAENGTPIDPKPWPQPDDVVKLTLGQIAMCESALERVTWTGNPDALVPARKIMALTTAKAKLQQSATAALPTKPEQSPTVGFRGLANVSWTYPPLTALKSKDRKYAEAAAFKIYQARSPLDAAYAAQSAACSADLSVPNATNVVELTSAEGAAVLASISAGVPALVLIAQANGLCAAYAVIDAKSTAEGVATARLESLDGAPRLAKGTKIEGTLHVAHELWIAEQNPGAPQTSLQLLLPVGGGPQEIFSWWIVPMSYAGLEARPQACPRCHQSFTGSIQPPAPSQLQATQPTRADEHRLTDVAKHRAVLPADVALDSDAANLPRLVVNWTPGDNSSDVYLLIERDEREVVDHTKHLKLMSSTGEWEALKSIEGLPDGAWIEKSWLDSIRQNWLRGLPVESEAITPDSFRRIGGNMEVPAKKGIVELTDPTVPRAGASPRPTFIDYYGRNGDAVPAMDGSYEFRYRLRSFRYLQTADGPQYLYSRPTAWTEFAIPERPAIDVTITQRLEQDAPLYAPRVTFRFSPNQTKGEKNPRWFFRALVRRYINVPMPSTAPGAVARDGVWIDIGQPAVIEWDGSTAAAVDDELQREWAGQSLKLKYRVLVQAFRRDIIEGMESDILVRSFDERAGHGGHAEFDVPIAGVANEAADEKDVTIEVTVQ